MARRKPLTRERMLEAAMALADAEGLDAVTMRRLAAELGVEAMSLYHHVPNKDALLDGLVDAIIGEVHDATSESSGAGWRAALRDRCLAARAGTSGRIHRPGAAVGQVSEAVRGAADSAAAAVQDVGVVHRAHRDTGRSLFGSARGPARR